MSKIELLDHVEISMQYKEDQSVKAAEVFAMQIAIRNAAGRYKVTRVSYIGGRRVLPTSEHIKGYEIHAFDVYGEFP